MQEIVKTGEKIHLTTNRRFENDIRRHFIGEIDEIESSFARVEGFHFIFDTTKNIFSRKAEKRILLLNLSSSDYLIHIIPTEVILEQLEYVYLNAKRLTLTDGGSFNFDISEYGLNR